MKDSKVLLGLIAGFAAGTLLGALFSKSGKTVSKKKIEKEVPRKEEFIHN